MNTDNQDCLFEKIVTKEIPATIVYEDEYTMAFLDIAPVSLGHTLVIPKKHVTNIFDVDQETLNHVLSAVRKIAPAVRDSVGAHGVQINSNHAAEAGQVIFHLHFHIIPRHNRADYEFWPKVDVTPEQTSETAQKIRELL
jgi:histidine triad (HIT) family protein